MEIPGWAKLIDLMLALAGIKQRRRREVFEHLLVPIHELFGDIHKDYLVLFESTKAACPVRSGSAGWEYERAGKRVTVSRKADVSKALVQAKKEFAKGRKRLEPDRTDVRARVSTILKAPVGKEEKRYLWGVLSYLLYPAETIGSARQIDAEISSVVRRGSVRAMRTPSSRLLERIEPVADADEVFELVEDCEGHLRKRWAEVAALWADAHLNVLRKTTPLKDK
jgi:hypothetical protein